MSRINKSMERLRFYWDFSIDLSSQCDKPFYLWSWGGYILYNAIITRKSSKNLVFLLSEEIWFAILFILSTAIIMQTNLLKSPLVYTFSYKTKQMTGYLICALFYRTNKHQFYAAPLWSCCFVSLHHKVLICKCRGKGHPWFQVLLTEQVNGTIQVTCQKL